MNRKSFRLPFIKILPLFVLCLLFNALICAQDFDTPGEGLYIKFKTAAKLPCGQRDEAIRLGNDLIEKYGNDELNKDVIEFVKKKTAQIEKEEKRCRPSRCIVNGKITDWKCFFELSKEIFADEGDSPLALDVMLTLVSVGYNRAFVDKDDTFNNDMLNYAKLAIQRIEAGQKSQTGKWGVFEPFGTKENALGWMNYIIGLISYNKLNQQREGLGYFYKSIQFQGENQRNWETFQSFGNFYSNEAARLYMEYREKRKSNNNKETNESRAILGIARGNAERAIDAYGRAYKLAVEKGAKKEIINEFHNRIIELYKFRFNILPNKKLPDVDKYIEKLITRPMPDPTTPVKPVTEETIEYIPNKPQ